MAANCAWNAVNMSGLAFSLGSKRPAEGPGRPGQVKKPAKVSDLFGADSDEEEPPVPQHVSAKQRGVLPVPASSSAKQAAHAGAASTSGRSLTPPAAAPPPPGPAAAEQAQRDMDKAKADSVKAMEEYMKRMEQKEAEKAKRDAEEEEERKRRVPLLNETSFDRRKVTAVYRSDGTRGHHMADFIPPEELAKLLAQGGDAAAKAAAEAMEKRKAIGADNIGHKLLSKMGWKEGEAVGASKSGITAPIQAGGVKQDNLGLGAEVHGQVNEGDDAFEQYRKRCMLGYKHRPNPLGNPRKQYY